MGIDFELSKQHLGPRSVTITSWYDDRTRNWRASAPSYPYVQRGVPADEGACSTRMAAIDRLVRQLTAYFAVPEAVSSGKIAFL